MVFYHIFIGYWVSSENKDYLKYLTFEVEKVTFKNCLINFIKKLTYKYDHQLVFKTLLHTARIKLILEIFPNAKFINIVRNPYDVFQSTQ